MRLLAAKWRRGRDSNPCGVAPKRFSRPPRYDRFDTSPYMKLSFDRNHQIFNCFRNSFRNALLCCCQSAEKVRCCKAFQGFCDRCARKFSRPPRYDRFDIPPYLTLILYHKLLFLSTPFCYFLLLPFSFPIFVFSVYKGFTHAKSRYGIRQKRAYRKGTVRIGGSPLRGGSACNFCVPDCAEHSRLRKDRSRKFAVRSELVTRPFGHLRRVACGGAVSALGRMNLAARKCAAGLARKQRGETYG